MGKNAMGKSFEEMVVERPPDWDKVEEIKREMMARVRGYRLRDLRETYGMTQLDLARSLHMSIETISRIEHGDIESMRIETLRRCVEGLGGTLKVEVELGDTRFRLA
jgi:DNA-binding XRE family transcriptional regulator